MEEGRCWDDATVFTTHDCTTRDLLLLTLRSPLFLFKFMYRFPMDTLVFKGISL